MIQFVISYIMIQSVTSCKMRLSVTRNV